MSTNQILLSRFI